MLHIEFYSGYYFYLNYDFVTMEYFVEVLLPPGNHYYSFYEAKTTYKETFNVFRFEQIRAGSEFILP